MRLFEQSNGMIKLRWRGKLDRIPSEPKIRPERVPMFLYGKSQLIMAGDIAKDKWVLPTKKEASDIFNAN